MFNDALKESELDKDKILNRGTFTSDAAMQIESNFLNAKQVIFIGQKQFEFSQFDMIFTLTHSPFLEELGLTVS